MSILDEKVNSNSHENIKDSNCFNKEIRINLKYTTLKNKKKEIQFPKNLFNNSVMRRNLSQKNPFLFNKISSNEENHFTIRQVKTPKIFHQGFYDKSTYKLTNLNLEYEPNFNQQNIISINETKTQNPHISLNINFNDPLQKVITNNLLSPVNVKNSLAKQKIIETLNSKYQNQINFNSISQGLMKNRLPQQKSKFLDIKIKNPFGMKFDKNRILDEKRNSEVLVI